MGMTAIKHCGCSAASQGAAYQERQHGPGMRVHNECAEGWRCTCCGKVKGK